MARGLAYIQFKVSCIFHFSVVYLTILSCYCASGRWTIKGRVTTKTEMKR